MPAVPALLLALATASSLRSGWQNQSSSIRFPVQAAYTTGSNSAIAAGPTANLIHGQGLPGMKAQTTPTPMTPYAPADCSSAAAAGRVRCVPSMTSSAPAAAATQNYQTVNFVVSATVDATFSSTGLMMAFADVDGDGGAARSRHFISQTPCAALAHICCSPMQTSTSSPPAMVHRPRP